MIRIRIETDGAAFGDGGGSEVARILRRLAADVEDAQAGDRLEARLLDVNGNGCGDIKGKI